jgi:hypothetical protein
MPTFADMVFVRKTAISAFVLLVLGSQLIIGFTHHSSSRWPIVSYPMYRVGKNDGDRFDDYNVYVVRGDGKQVLINPLDDMGMSFWIFQKNIIMPIIKGRQSSADPIRKKYCQDGDSEISVKVFDIGVSISASGPVYGEPEEVKTLAIKCEE